MTFSRLALILAPVLAIACGAPEQSPRPFGDDDVNARGDSSKHAFDKPMAPVLMPDVVEADQRFADATLVKEDRLIVATAGNEKMLAKIKVGAVLAGNRSSKPAPLEENGNPTGFLRRVKSMTTEGDHTLIVTKKATLDDYLKEGDLIFGAGAKKPVADGAKAKSSLETKSLNLLDADDQEGSGSGSQVVEVNASLGAAGAGVKFSNSSLNVNAKFDGYWKVRYRPTPAFPDPPTGVAFKSVLTLDPQFSTDVEISFSAQRETPPFLKWPAPGVPAPGFMVPLPSPVPVTLRIAPQFECQIQAGGQATYGFNVKLNAHSVDGFEGDAEMNKFKLEDRSEPATVDGDLTVKSIQSKAIASMKCTLFLASSLLIFDTLGVVGKVGPYFSVNAEMCSGHDQNGDKFSPISLYAELGLTGKFNGVIQIPLLANMQKEFQGLGIDIVGKKFFAPGYSDSDCEAQKPKDSCVGKADNFYCSELAPNSGYMCQGEQIAYGLQCEESQTCAGGTADQIYCK